MELVNILLIMGGGAASFIGSYAAQRVHLEYMRRDIDYSLKWIDEHKKVRH
jgi:hypothetical protein